MADTAEPTLPLRIPWLWTVVIVVADQVAKFWAVTSLKLSPQVSVIPGFFNLCYVENHGAAWGMLGGQRFFLIAFSIVVSLVFFLKRRQVFGGLYCGGLIFATLLGGIIGNLIDRIRVGYVIDFLDFHWKQSHFPAFNIADAAICCATFALIITHWMSERKAKKDKTDNGEYPTSN